jgi:hypothetical protein
MVKRDDQIFSQGLEIGEANQRLLPRVKAWCRHIDVQMTSSGVLAQMTGLPVGHLKVVCPHGITLSESAHLSWEVSEFIPRNCVGCAHHEEISPDNYGREVLAEKERRDQEEADAAAQRKELSAQSYEAASAALKSGHPKEESVNRFVLDMFGSQEEADRSRALLIEAAELGWDCFSEAALKVLGDGFGGANGVSCIEAARIVCRHRKMVHSGLIVKAMTAVGQRRDVACGLLSDAIECGYNAADVLAELPLIVAVPEYGRFGVLAALGGKSPEYSGTIELVRKLIELDPAAVRGAFAERLKSPEKMVRFNAIRLLTDFLPGQVDAILGLTDALLRSLELPDDIYDGASADGAASNLLAHLYAYAPHSVEPSIQQFLPLASMEARMLVLDMYSRLALLGVEKERERWPGRRGFEGFDRDLYAKHARMSIDQLFGAIGDIRVTPHRRFEICNDLKELIRCNPDEGIARAERILGRLMITVREAQNAPAPASGDALAAMEASSRDSSYDAVQRVLTKMVDELARHKPREVFAAVRDLLSRLSSKDEAEREAKGQLIRTLSTFAKTYELVPDVVRELYKHLVDFESVGVRAIAIRVAGDLLSSIPQSVPDNIVELLTVYLGDEYIAIHQNAVRALAACRFGKDERGRRVLNCLVQMERCYREKPRKTYFLREILATLRRSFREWPEVKRYVALTLLPVYVGFPDKHFAEDMLVLIGEQVSAYPELARPFVQAALDHLKSTERDRYNDDTHTNRGKLRDRLYEVPLGALTAETERLRGIVQVKAGKDAFDVIRLLEILSFRELYAEAAALAEEALSLVPEVKAHAFERESYSLVWAAAMTESLVAQGRVNAVMDTVWSTDDQSDEEEEEGEDENEPSL